MPAVYLRVQLDVMEPFEQTITMPEIGARGLPVQISCWLADLGELVHEGDRLIEVALPGLTFDVPAPSDGRLISIEKVMGEEVHPGEILGRLLMSQE